ncbi:MAG TPA: preprotein translocase subunit SecA [Thermoleophilia bacterium]|nr:preprotein translocase subunit SecA [Thermoleophilia bacterium]
MSIVDKLLRAGEGKRAKQLEQQVRAVNELEPTFAALSDEQLRAKTVEFRERHANGELLDDLLFEAFAAAREAAKRALGMRPFDVQVMGGIVLHEGDIAEMKTGEGKTLVATMPMYLNALAGRGAHLVTVNDYLAKRDAEWMGQVYRFLGLEVGCIQAMMDPSDRREQYNADVTYGTNSEFGFDYLRDNMAMRREHMVQRGHYYCIVDEVDSILIDEARTPLIISGAPETAADTYRQFARIVPRLREGEDYEVDEKQRTVAVTEQGVAKVERALDIDNLYKESNGALVNHLIQALRAQSLYKRDVDYVVQDGEVKIVDEFTGRIMEGRRWSEGLHQAIEAKERVPIREENQTLATITLQNYFRMYEVLAGMTGTAKTEEDEFRQIYGLEVVQIPTNAPMIRRDENDFIFRTTKEKFDAVVDDIVQRYEQGQPVLVGTVSVEVSEMLSRLLERRGVPHDVLNAKQHEREAGIIEGAGRRGAVTIATNMAGRGVDIKLGEGVVELGGLYVLGTERHESRRIDNQLRGRSGRQGDPGESRFYLSAEDELIRLFSGDRMYKILDRLGPEDGMPIEHKMLSNVVERAQKKVEELNFLRRKNVLKYDEVMNEQRRVIYDQRQRILMGEDFGDQVREMVAEAVEGAVRRHTGQSEYPEDWDLDALFTGLRMVYDPTVGKKDIDLDTVTADDVVDLAVDDALRQYDERERLIGAEQMRNVERAVMLQIIDSRWKEHLQDMDYLQEGIHLRALGQRDPLVEYKSEGFELFQDMLAGIKTGTVTALMKNAPEDLVMFTSLALEEPLVALNYSSGDELANTTSFAAVSGGEYPGGDGGGEPMRVGAPASTGGAAATAARGRADRDAAARTGGVAVQQRRVEQKIGRNDPCWCGSGKKYKKCHGA